MTSVEFPGTTPETHHLENVGQFFRQAVSSLVKGAREFVRPPAAQTPGESFTLHDASDHHQYDGFDGRHPYTDVAEEDVWHLG